MTGYSTLVVPYWYFNVSKKNSLQTTEHQGHTNRLFGFFLAAKIPPILYFEYDLFQI